MANPLNGKETFQVLGQDNNGLPAATTQTTTTGALATLVGSGSTTTKITQLATVGNGAVSAASIFGKITQRTGTQVAAFTDTTDTATNIIAAMGASPVIGTAFKYTYENTTSFPATLTGGTGVTVSGLTIIPANSWVEYLVTYTAANTVTIAAYEAGITVLISGTNFVTVATAAPVTLTGAQVGGGYSDVTINMTAALAAGGAVTLPTVANLLAAVPNGAPGISWNLRIINSSSGAFAWTVTTNTGWTLNGTMTIAQNTFRDFVLVVPTATTATLTSAGTGTTS